MESEIFHLGFWAIHAPERCCCLVIVVVVDAGDDGDGDGNGGSVKKIL